MYKGKIKRRLDELKPSNMSTEEWHDYTNDIASCLGRFIMAFNDLDQETTLALAELVRAKGETDAALVYFISSNKNFAQKIFDLEALLNYRIEGKKEKAELASEIKNLTTEIKTLNRQRNAWVHADWYETDKEENAVHIKSKTLIDKQGVYHEYLKCQPEDIELLEDKCEDLLQLLHELLKKLK